MWPHFHPNNSLKVSEGVNNFLSSGGGWAKRRGRKTKFPKAEGGGRGGIQDFLKKLKGKPI